MLRIFGIGILYMQMYIAFYILQLDFEDQFKQAVVDKCIVIFRFHNLECKPLFINELSSPVIIGKSR